MRKINSDWIFSKCFKTVMSFLFLFSFVAMYINKNRLNLSDFEEGFLSGFQITAQGIWIIFVIICAYNKQSPFVAKNKKE